jgi:hypothetical protein
MLSPRHDDESLVPAKSRAIPTDLRDPSRLGLHLVGDVEREKRLLGPAR